MWVSPLKSPLRAFPLTPESDFLRGFLNRSHIVGGLVLDSTVKMVGYFKKMSSIVPVETAHTKTFYFIEQVSSRPISEFHIWSRRRCRCPCNCGSRSDCRCRRHRVAVGIRVGMGMKVAVGGIGAGVGAGSLPQANDVEMRIADSRTKARNLATKKPPCG